MNNACHIVKPLSTLAVKRAALDYRDKNSDCINKYGVIDVLKVLEAKHKKYVIVPDEELLLADAITKANGEILIRESVYVQAYYDDYRSRFTIAHELGHAVLHAPFDGFGQGRDILAYKERYYDSEWQANTFAAELLIPTSTLIYLRTEGVSLDVISKKFMVSKQCLETKINKI